MRPIAKFLVLGCLLIAAGIGATVMLAPREKKSVEACRDAKSEARAPGGAYKSELIVHTCGWDFGQAAETVDVKVTKLGADGWFMHLAVEYDSIAEDQGIAIPTAEWTAPQELLVTVHSKSRTGTIVSKHQGLTVTRIYLAP